jgi:hypothetical protein
MGRRPDCGRYLLSTSICVTEPRWMEGFQIRAIHPPSAGPRRQNQYADQSIFKAISSPSASSSAEILGARHLTNSTVASTVLLTDGPYCPANRFASFSLAKRVDESMTNATGSDVCRRLRQTAAVAARSRANVCPQFRFIS